MYKFIPFILLSALMVCGVDTNGQNESRRGFQTNLGALARLTAPALNLGYVVEKDRVQFTFDTDMNFFIRDLRGRSKENVLMNHYKTYHQNLISFDFSAGADWFISEQKGLYVGVRGNLGYFNLRHRQLLCNETEQISGICFCSDVQDYRFNTRHLRLGSHVRFGFVSQISEKTEVDMNVEFGFFGYVRSNLNAIGQHEICDFTQVDQPDDLMELNLPIMTSLLRGSLLDFDRNNHLSIRFGLIFRFFR
jgi:hypothetical protein